jgi:hypothetical protein
LNELGQHDDDADDQQHVHKTTEGGGAAPMFYSEPVRPGGSGIANEPELWSARLLRGPVGMDTDHNRGAEVVRLAQEVARLGGDCAHILTERIDVRHDDAAGEAWLHGRFSYMLYRRGNQCEERPAND